jgi:hypothetical protein
MPLNSKNQYAELHIKFNPYQNNINGREECAY